ncbi:DEAD/DEAH box helicase [Lancefieldella rimae]|uniref:DEAD/DEAH box helicase n=1 Tax=Lancefieldella rimae TaxID=1383 RepID=UPI00288C4884|nr:DEAD/DEAH box helicase [Lancefieldella rimae]
MDTTFAELGLNERILTGVTTLGFNTPTPIQAAAIPAVLAGKDVVASAQTGTGKTAAFVLPALQVIDTDTEDEKTDRPEVQCQPQDGQQQSSQQQESQRRRQRGGKRRRNRTRDPQALIVTPTRELATQIERVATTICKSTGQRAVIITGGAKLKRQISAVQAGCDLLVATPGRLLDLVEHHQVNLKSIKVFILDEADRMLDMGFWPSVRRIMDTLPPKRQTLLFSATLPPSITSTIDNMLHDPTMIEIARAGQTADTVEEHLCPVVQGQKVELLESLIRSFRPAPERILVFCRTKLRVDSVYTALNNAGFKVDVMHADRPQGARTRALTKFRNGTIQVLVATDVMSRGIDVQGIDAVVNFDVPLDPEDYVHRIGRTGRAGSAGQAFTFMAPDEIAPLREIEYFTKSLIATWDLPNFGYQEGRIVLPQNRPATKPIRPMFSGSKARGRGFGGRYGRHF